MRAIRRAGLIVAAALAVAACTRVRQPLGSLEPVGAAGAGGNPPQGMPTGTQIPSLIPEWGACNPAVLRCFQDPTLTPSSPVSGQFSGTPDPDPTAKPTIVYPLPGSMHPINLADITFQWKRGLAATQTLFRIRLRRLSGDAFEFYVPCTHPTTPGPLMDLECVYHMPAGAWIDLATTVHGETLTVDIAGVDLLRPDIVATSDPMTISFSPEYVSGGFYYWSTSIQGAMRLLFGARAIQPYIIQNSPSNPYSCSGCHTVSRSGSTMAFTEGESVTGVLRVVATPDATKQLFPSATAHDSAMMALNRDGTRVLVSYAGKLVLRDAASGATLVEVPTSLLGGTRRGYHPEWSPDDKMIALTLSADGTTDVAVRTGAIGILPYDPTASPDAAFGAVQEIVPSGTEFNFYPTWSPDGHWLAFATAPVTAGQTSYIQPQARLRLVNRDTLTVYELANATVEAGRTVTYPKFAPVAQSGGLMFLTFNSKKDYGFFVQTTVGSPQLWITSIDPRKLHQATDDPSTAPVWLPFQSVKERNYLGFWSERIGCRVDASGGSVGCGLNEVCSNGACAMVAP
jgi:WD40-like Beta Propeller Repeat